MKNSIFHIIMISGAKGLNSHELAHKWVKDLGTLISLLLYTDLRELQVGAQSEKDGLKRKG